MVNVNCDVFEALRLKHGYVLRLKKIDFELDHKETMIFVAWGKTQHKIVSKVWSYNDFILGFVDDFQNNYHYEKAV